MDRPHRHGPLARLWDWLADAPAAEHLIDSQRREIEAAVVWQEAAVLEEFNKAHDTFRLVGQDNLRRYRCVDSMVIRVDGSDSMVDAIVAVSAAAAVGTQVVLSIDPRINMANQALLESIADWLPGLVDPMAETVAELTGRLEKTPVARLRCLSPSVDDSLLVVCARKFISVVKEPVIRDGRFECLRYLNEQSISHNYHRYGNLGRRQGEHFSG